MMVAVYDNNAIISVMDNDEDDNGVVDVSAISNKSFSKKIDKGTAIDFKRNTLKLVIPFKVYIWD